MVIDIEPVLREDVDTSQHGFVDAALKEAHTVFRHLKALRQSLNQEITLLHRMHYKGNNQLRTTLFWKKSLEVTRLTKRIAANDLCEVLDTVVRQFHTKYLDKRQLWRTAWTRLPASSFLASMHSLMQKVLQLVQKGIICSETTYSILLVQIRSAAFMPLVICISSIVARLHTHMSEISALIQQILPRIEFLISLYRPSLSNAEGNSISKEALASCSRNEIEDATTACINNSPAQETESEAKANSIKGGSSKIKQKSKHRKVEPTDEIDEIFGF